MKSILFFIFLVCSILYTRTVASAQPATQQNDTTKKSPKDSLNSKAVNQTISTEIHRLDSVSKSQQKTAVSEKLIESQKNALEKSLDSLGKRKKMTEADIQKATALRKKIQNAIAQQTKLNEKLKQQSIDQQHIIDSLKTATSNLNSQKQRLQIDADSLKSTKKNLQQKNDSLVNSVAAEQAIIAKQKDSLEVVATITMNNTIKVFKEGTEKKPQLLFSTKVQSVHVLVREGLMLEIVVVTDSGVFRNKSGIIDLLHFGERTGDHLVYEKQQYRPHADSLFIYVGNAITYAPVRSYSDLPYADFDITLIPIKPNNTFLLRESTSINTYFDIAAFTDIQGIGGSPNGIAQFEANAKFITNTKNTPNTSLVLFNYVSFTGGLAKFDSKFNGTQVFANDSVSRVNLLQRSTYQVGIKVNLLREFPSPFPHHLFDNMELNVGYNFIGTKVFVTGFRDVAKTVPDTNFRTVTQNMLYIEPLITLSRHRNFSLTLSAPFDIVSVKQSADIKNLHNEFWTCPSIDLMYFGKRDTGNKLFFRYHYFININNPSQAFNQLQLGYSLSLTNVWGGQKDSK